MLKNISIKMKLISSFSVIALLICILAGYSYYGVGKSSDGFTSYREMAKDSLLVSSVQSNMLMVRMNVKDYLTTVSKKDIDEFNSYYKKTNDLIQVALKEIQKPSRSPFVKEMSMDIQEYQQHFYKVIDYMNERNHIVNNNLNVNGKEIEHLLTSVMDSSEKDKDMEASLSVAQGIRTLLLARLYVSKYLESNAIADQKRVSSEFSTLRKQLISIQGNIQNPIRINQLKESMILIEKYKGGVASIEKIIKERNDIINNKLNIIGPKIAKLAQNIKESVKADQDVIGPNVARLNQNLTNTSITVSAIIIAMVLLLAVFIPRNISRLMNTFQEGLIDFFKYLNRETQDTELIKIDSSDEFGIMTKLVNENITKTKKGIEEDRKFIDETIAVLSEFEQGDLCQRISSSVDNPALMQLKKVLDSMASNLETNIESVLDVLEEYSNYNYLNKVDNSNVKNQLLQLTNGVNSLGESISKMLVENKSIGQNLNASSNTLLKNVKILNASSTEAATSLEETAAALEEITSTVVANNDSVEEMASFAQKVIVSVEEGNKLANQTMNSMDEIDTQVTAINTAISVIDKIAFQTNILSLNAAVEAATAGEQGKGFAVVAAEVRNLAARSTQAAEEIKALVEKANETTNAGKRISDEMIQGNSVLTQNIKNTIRLIEKVDIASKEQQSGIEQINDAVTSQDKQTQQIASAASNTYEIAMGTASISNEIVQNVDTKEFVGKGSTTPSRESNNNILDERVKDICVNNSMSDECKKPDIHEVNKTNYVSAREEEWESF